MMLLLLLGFVGSINSLQPNWNNGFFSIEGMTGDSMYAGSPNTDSRYSAGSDSRYESRGGRPAEGSAPEQNSQRRQDAGNFQNQGGFNIPFASDFSFSEFGSPFGNPEEFQQLLSGFRNGANSAPSDFSQQDQPQFQAPNFGQINQRRSSEESRRPSQSTFKRETPINPNSRPGGQVARQLDRFAAEDFVRPRPVYVPTPAPVYQPRTSTYNYGRYEAETEPEKTFRQPVYKPEYRPEFKEPAFPKQEYNEPAYSKQEFNKPSYPKQEYNEPAYSKQEFNEPAYSKQEYNKPAFPIQEFNKPAFPKQENYEPAYSRQEYKEREYKKPAYTSAFKTTKKPTKVAQKKPTESFVKPFATEDFNFDAQKYDIQKEVSQPNERNAPSYHAEEKKYDTAPESSGFFHHENLKNHKLDNNKHMQTEEKYNNYQDDFYSPAGNNPALEQGSFFEDRPEANFFSGSESQQPSVDTYTPPQAYAPTQSFIQPPEVFSTTERNSAFFGQNQESQGPFKNQEFFAPTPAAPPSGYNSKRQTDTSGYIAQGAPSIYKNSKLRLKSEKKGSFQPPKLVERFNTPVVKPSLPFSPPEAIEVEDHHEHQEQHDFNGSPVTVERFPAEPVVPSYSTSQAAIPPYSPQQPKPTKGLGKKPVSAPKKPHVPEHKYEQKNYRKPIVNQGSTTDDHPIMRVKPGQATKQAGRPQPPAEFRNEKPAEFRNEKPVEYRNIDEPSKGYRRMDPKPVMPQHEKISDHMEGMREGTSARQLPDYDDSQEIITAFTDFKKASSHSGNSGKETFNVNVHASFSPSLNPEDQVRRSARGAIPPSPINRRGGPRIKNIRMKPKKPSHNNSSNNKKQRFYRRN